MATKHKPAWLLEYPQERCSTPRLLCCRNDYGQLVSMDAVASIDPWHEPTNYYAQESRIDGWTARVGDERVVANPLSSKRYRYVFDNFAAAKRATIARLGVVLDGIVRGLAAVSEVTS